MTQDSFWRYALTVALCLCVCLFTTALTRDATAFAPALNTTQPPTENSMIPTEITQPPALPDTEPEAVISFSPGELIDVFYQTQVDADPENLLCSGLSWDLTGPGPTVLILHTHTSEGYADTYDRENFRTDEVSGNMLAIGDEVARVLALGGITAIHDRTVYDTDYSGSYTAARQSIRGYLEEYPSIRLVLDLHRDAADGDTPLITTATVCGQNSAQLAMVLGSNFPGWEQNFALALKVSALLEREDPGICRPLSLRGKTYNLDLCPGSLLVEVGATGNTRQEALIAANALANAIAELAKGATPGPLV